MGKKSTVSKKGKSPHLRRAAGASTPVTASPVHPVAVSSPEVVSLSSETGSSEASPSPATDPATPPVAVASYMVGPAVSSSPATGGSTMPGPTPMTGSTMGLMSAVPVASAVSPSPATGPASLLSSPETPPVAVASYMMGPVVSSSPAIGVSTMPGPTPMTGLTMGLKSGVPVASCIAAVSPSPATGGSVMAAVLQSPVVAGAVAPPTMNMLMATASKNRRKALRRMMNKLKKRAAALAADNQLAGAGVPATVTDSIMAADNQLAGAGDNQLAGAGVPATATDSTMAADNQPAGAGVPVTVTDSTMTAGAVSSGLTVNISSVQPADAVGKCEVEFGGVIFHCDDKTRPECFRYGIFGLGKKKANLVEKIRAGTVLFLFDIQTRVLNGIYRATGSGGLNLEAEAFDGRFPAQVRFMVEKDCLPVPESVFKDVIKENYVKKRFFHPELNSQQVNKLLPLFSQIKVQTHSVPFQTPIGATAPSPAADSQIPAVGDPSLPSVTLTTIPRGARKRGRKSSEKKKSNGASVHSGTANGTSEALIEGFIFHCDRTTKPECFTHRIFGLRKKHSYLVEKIRAGTLLFLFDTELRILYGVYRAAGDGGVNLVPEAFGGKFPAQVRFRIDDERPPVPESVFKDAIKENYKSNKKFSQVLSSQQVNMLLPLFTSSMAHLPPTQPYFEQPRGARHIGAPPHASYGPSTHHIFDARQLPPTPMPPPNVPSYLVAPTHPYYPRVDPSSLHTYNHERPPSNVHGWVDPSSLHTYYSERPPSNVHGC